MGVEAKVVENHGAIPAFGADAKAPEGPAPEKNLLKLINEQKEDEDPEQDANGLMEFLQEEDAMSAKEDKADVENSPVEAENGAIPAFGAKVKAPEGPEKNLLKLISEQK